VGEWNGATYRVRCNGITGQYRAYVDCWHVSGDRYTPRKGVWRFVPTGQWSTVQCLSNEEPGTAFAELR
jgi:hypothetical protein